MKSKEVVDKNSGFTLIEMIGVIAVIAILAAFIAPKVLDVIQDSKTTRFVGEINTYKSGVIKWYKDIGTLQSLVAAGTITATDTDFHDELITNGGTTPTTGLWSRWSGPYIDTVASVSIGTALTIETNTGSTGTGAPSAADSLSFDLDDNNVNDMGTRQVVALKLTDVTNTEFVRVDASIDNGLTPANNATSGRIKYDSGNSILYVYVSSN